MSRYDHSISFDPVSTRLTSLSRPKLERNSTLTTQDYPLTLISSTPNRKPMKAEYRPVPSSKKLALLLQRSFRYSYRQRCCGCCPTILCELLFPLLLLGILLLTRYGTNALIRDFANNTNTLPEFFNGTHCSQELEQISRKSQICFQYPSKPFSINPRIHLLFQPKTDQIDQLVELAKRKLNASGCTQIDVRSETPDEEREKELLQNFTLIIDFPSGTNFREDRKLTYRILVRMPMTIPKNDPIDLSFLSYLHPSFIRDRAPDLPDFADLKILLDNLFIQYQSNRSIEYLFKRRSMTCTPFRRDFINESGTFLITTILIMVDLIFFIPFLILLLSLIREKNAKVKEILKVLGIAPILNHIAQAIRTLIILLILTILLCAIYKWNLKPDAFFNRIHFGTLFLGYLIYALQLISFSIISAQIYDRVVRSILGSIGFYLFSLILYPNILSWPTPIQYILIFISPFIGGYSLFQQFSLHELALTDVKYFHSIYRSVPMYFPTLMVMIGSSIVYWFFSWYIEKISPGEYGLGQPWNFLFKSSDRSKTTKKNRISPCPDASSISLSQSTLHQTAIVQVDHLTKQFAPDRIAVNDVSFDLYENQITSLLGPNGSGKTTIFNCLIGMYQPTSGRIVIEAEDGLQEDSRDLRQKSIGYCPQYDILFDLFTVKEQLQFYATARGFGTDANAIAEEMLRFVNLQSSKNLYCRSLSGGMKRRLSLACAFVGDTKIVLLDEPSSGLDPSNRRALWDWLRTMKEGKTLLLTTHFMEESDALSDRILIISNGTIKADGTSAQLKEQYGSGYKFVISKSSSTRPEEVQSHLRRYLPQISIENDSNHGDLILRTNQRPNDEFLRALRELERMKQNEQIKDYGVQNSTLDDVFTRITRDKKSTESTRIDAHRIEKQCQRVFQHQYFFTGTLFYLSQFYGLFIKTSRVHSRRWGLTLVLLFVPILYHLLANLISRSRNDLGVFSMNLHDLNPQTILYQSDPSIEKDFQSTIQSESKGKIRLEQHSFNLSEMNRYIHNQRSIRPSTYTEIYFGFILSSLNESRYEIDVLSSNLISGYEAIAVASNTFYKYVINDTDASIETTLIYKNTGNFTVQPSVSDLLNLLSTASCAFKFLPTSLILDVFVFYLLFFYASVFLISERKDSFLSLLNISGLHPVSYWIFTYLFDLFITVIWLSYLLLVFCLIDLSFHGFPKSSSSSILNIAFEFASPWDLRVRFYPLTILIALPCLPMSYLMTKLFKNDILGGITIGFIFLFLHLVSIVIPVVNILVRSSSTRQLLYWLFNILFPSINSQVLVTYLLARQSRFCQLATLLFDGIDFRPFGDDTIGWNVVLLLVHLLLFLSLIILIDTGSLRCSFSCFYRSTLNETELDEDVRAERHRQFDDRDHLIVEDLVKYYPMKKVLAVNHLTFAARRGEAFGLLGYNGAGKTTTFRILVGDLPATRGQCKVHGGRRYLGYCPQENCAMDFLTVEESLYLLARIRGVRFSRISSLVSTISALFLLDPFLNNPIHQLSGGTKRRLHAALALIGPPRVAILDEPTTGVDPNARQQMQEVFANAVKNNLTLILTSHSMDECERVCHRLGILVRGQFACLGTIQHLKSKFGRGYTIEIKVRTNPNDFPGTAMEKVRAFLLNQSDHQIEVKEMTHSTGLFQCQRSNPADLFHLLECHKQALNIETYTISQTTLEQIFLSMGGKTENPCTSLSL